MVERWIVHLRAGLGVERLHQVDLDCVRPEAEPQDVLLHVLGLTRVLADLLDAKCVHPKATQPTDVETADGDLLKAEDSKGTFSAHGAERYRSTAPPNQSRPAALRSTGVGYSAPCWG